MDDRGQAASDPRLASIGIVVIIGIFVFDAVREHQLAAIENSDTPVLCAGFGGCNGRPSELLIGLAVVTALVIGVAIVRRRWSAEGDE